MCSWMDRWMDRWMDGLPSRTALATACLVPSCRHRLPSMSPSRCTHLTAVAVSCLSQASLQCPGGNNRRAVGRTALPWAGAPAQPWARVRYEMELEGHRSGTATTVGAYLAVQYLLRTACSLSPPLRQHQHLSLHAASRAPRAACQTCASAPCQNPTVPSTSHPPRIGDHDHRLPTLCHLHA